MDLECVRTAIRRLDTSLHDETQRDLVGRLRLSPSELESVDALVRSQLEVSLSDALAGAAGEPEGAP
jgi:hypothetical protein